jgi:HK97 family phage prohead protease
MPNEQNEIVEGSPLMRWRTCKALNVSTKQNEEAGIVEAYVSVYDVVDSYNERVKFGAFADSLKQFLPKVLKGHDWNQNIGKTVEAVEVAAGDTSLPQEIKYYGGLFVRGDINLAKQIGQDTYSDLKGGYLDEFSIGYSVDQIGVDRSTGIVDLIKVTLYEWSVVLFGANPATMLTGLKSLPMTVEQHFDVVQTFAKQFSARIREIDQLRIKEGRTFSQQNYNRLNEIADDIRSCESGLRDLLSVMDSAKGLQIASVQEIEALKFISSLNL